MTNQQYQKCIDACIECVSSCNHCAVSCLEEKEVQSLTKCIQLDIECAVICRVAAELMSLESRYSKEVCELCATISNACADECEKHANMEHCKECAEVCRVCAKETMEMYQKLVKQDQEANESGRNESEKDYIGFVHQDECAAISRATAELISLGSAYATQISQLNAIICNASAEELEKYLNKEIKHSRECALIANEAHQHLKTQDQEMKEANMDVSKKNEQSVHQKEIIEKKKKHSSTLLAASLWRRAL